MVENAVQFRPFGVVAGAAQGTGAGFETAEGGDLGFQFGNGGGGGGAVEDCLFGCFCLVSRNVLDLRFVVG